MTPSTLLDPFLNIINYELTNQQNTNYLVKFTYSSNTYQYPNLSTCSFLLSIILCQTLPQLPTCLGWVETVLHLNPVEVFGRRSAAGIWLVVAFTCAIIVGTTFFMRWDKMDRHEAIYLAEYKEKILEHIVRQSLQSGGKCISPLPITIRGC